MLTSPALLESAWYIRTNAARDKVEKEFGNVIFVDDINIESIFVTGVMNENKVNDLMERGITAHSVFRVLGDH